MAYNPSCSTNLLLFYMDSETASVCIYYEY